MDVRRGACVYGQINERAIRQLRVLSLTSLLFAPILHGHSDNMHAPPSSSGGITWCHGWLYLGEWETLRGAGGSEAKTLELVRCRLRGCTTQAELALEFYMIMEAVW